MNTRIRLRILNKARRRMEAWYASKKGEEGWIGGHCLWWAYFTCQVLVEHGVPAILQAGTAYWPRLTPEQDDGTSDATQFGYQYTPGPFNYVELARGKLPEMHVWAGVVASQTIIDLTAGYFPDQAKLLGGYDWPGVRPPNYYWGPAKDLPRGCVYEPHLEALKIACALIRAATMKEQVLIIPMED